MLPEEAKLTGRLLEQSDTDHISPCLNIGSSTGRFRSHAQPHIDRYIFSPLQARGVEVIHSDFKAAEGVDIAGDIYDDDVLAKIRACEPGLVMCCNMFEHVADRESLARRLDMMLQPDGMLLVTVPNSYPHHSDPIDTYFRPSPEELADMFSNYCVVNAGIVTDISYLRELLNSKGFTRTLLFFGESLLRLGLVWRGRAWYREYYHRFLWLFRPYKVTYLLLRKK